jgi:hypothetical protein
MTSWCVSVGQLAGRIERPSENGRSVAGGTLSAWPASDRIEVVDDRDDLVETGQLKRAADGVWRPDENDSAAGLDRASLGCGDHSHATRIHEAKTAEVDHEQGGRTFLDLRKLGDDALSDLEIKVAAHRDDHPVALGTRFNVEVQHRRAAWSSSRNL